MKAVGVLNGGVAGGRVSRRRDVENEEIQMYLSKLKELVPFMPKNRKLSKLEVIQYVIDYICDLQDALIDGRPETAALAAVVSRTAASPSRTPLGVLAPNTILSPTSCSSQEPTVAAADKASEAKPTLRPTRPVSC